MRNVEEISLKEGVRKLEKSFLASPSLAESYKNIGEREIPSLQRLSFAYDRKILLSYESILSVLSSIALKPYSVNKREEIVEMANKAGHLSVEAMRKTLRDSSLWKRYGSIMIPEEVYYFQYYDELITYENVFIITFLEMISSELAKYRAFYASLLKTSKDSCPLTEEGEPLSDALFVVSKLERKLLKIKNTSFYKAVAKTPKRIRNVIPTNVLLRNDKYHAAYKFYKGMAHYEDLLSLQSDFARYEYILILKEFHKEGYRLLSRGSSLLIDQRISLPDSLLFQKGKDIRYRLSYLEKENAFLFEGKGGGIRGNVLLYLAPNESLIESGEKENVDGVDFLSLWHYGYKKGEQAVLFTDDFHNEEELIHLFFSSHFHKNVGDEELYSRYCPVCRSEAIVEKEGRLFCENCHSIYHFDREKEIVFLNRRRE